jgi:dihydroorotate dehydrogenase
MSPVPTRQDCGKIHAKGCKLILMPCIRSGLQNRQLLEELLTGVIKARDQLAPSELTSRRPRLVLKIAPDLDDSQLIDIADVIKNSGIDGVIVSNTTIRRPSTLIDCTSLG